MANRLANETSPYLLQHKDNPVDWYPWGEEALAKAKAEDKPIFLSIGYAACHWCHVMEHESFEDPETARVLNEHFVSVKVDREERPDLDSIYMDAVVAMTGQGGWPTSVFLTPDGAPFFGGTYFPPQPRFNVPGFTQVLLGVADAWKTRRNDVLQSGGQVLDAIRQGDLPASPGRAQAVLSPEILSEAVRNAWSQFDWQRGGWGGAPKFPQPMTIEFLLRYHLRTGESLPMEMVTKTLDAMATGGMVDVLGGGFHRYSVDSDWLVPHFEKMLYDNAQLARAYTHAWQITRNPLYRRVAEETLDYVTREMTDPAGGFYSSQDADSEGEEGKFYAWTPDDIAAVLGEDATLFMDAYGVTPHGNFEGKNVLTRTADDETLARKYGLADDEVRARLADARRMLHVDRERRVHPGLDDKVLAAWNGLMLAAFAEAARAFDRADYLRTAERNAHFLLAQMRTPEGRLFRSWRRGQPKLSGFLEDYANVAEGMLSLYQSTFHPAWFEAARSLADAVLLHFAGPAGGFFDTPDDHETLVTRPKSTQDNALPSGNAMAVTVLSQLAAYTGEGRYAERVEQGLRTIAEVAIRHPTAFAQWLSAMAFTLYGPKEVALVGERESPDLQALIEVAFERYRPAQVVAVRDPRESSPVPLLHGRDPIDHRATAYVCRHFACAMPVSEPEKLRELLEG